MERSFDVVHPPDEAVSTQHENSSTKFQRDTLTTATEICKQDTVIFLGRPAKGRIGPRGLWIIVPQNTF